MATGDCRSTGRLFVTDHSTKMQFLVDTGSDVCVFPRSATKGRRTKTSTGSAINIYGYAYLKLNIGLRRDFSWQFIVADVTKAIIGVDFLSHYNLIVDVRMQRLIDANTTLVTPALPARPSDVVSSGKVRIGDTTYHDILREFPDIIRPSGIHRAPTHNTLHYTIC